MSNVHLNLKIDEARREISALQAKIEEHVRFFTESSIAYHSRMGPQQSGHWKRYDDMVFYERKLELAQQRLASLLLELTIESIDRLDSSVKTLDSSVGSLSNLTKRLVKSSKSLEYLTTILILMAITTVSVTLLPLNPYYAFITVISAFVVFIVVWRRARKELPKF